MDHVKQQVADRVAEQIFIRVVSQGLAVIGQKVDIAEAAKVARAAGHDYAFGGGTSLSSPARKPIT